jgi:hypothetical protein
MKDIIETDADGIFKYLSREEIDTMIKDKIDEMRDGKRKWSDTEVLYRRQVIYDYIRLGYSRGKIQEEIMNRWGCVKRSAQRYVKDALESLEEDNKEFVQKTRDVQRERIESLVSKAMEKNDFMAAVKALDLINKMDGLYNEKVALDIKAEGLKFNFGVDPTNNEQ